MIDITSKADTLREARASAQVHLTAEVVQSILDCSLPKGNPLEVARIAGIVAAKNASQILPFCHPLQLTAIEVNLQLHAELARVDITSRVKSIGKTGVEMEALTAVSVAALTVYDMCKSLGHNITISNIKLTYKSGGKSGVVSAPAGSSPELRVEGGENEKL